MSLGVSLELCVVVISAKSTYGGERAEWEGVCAVCWAHGKCSAAVRVKAVVHKQGTPISPPGWFLGVCRQRWLVLSLSHPGKANCTRCLNFFFYYFKGGFFIALLFKVKNMINLANSCNLPCKMPLQGNPAPRVKCFLSPT